MQTILIPALKTLWPLLLPLGICVVPAGVKARDLIRAASGEYAPKGSSEPRLPQGVYRLRLKTPLSFAALSRFLTAQLENEDTVFKVLILDSDRPELISATERLAVLNAIERLSKTDVLTIWVGSEESYECVRNHVPEALQGRFAFSPDLSGAIRLAQRHGSEIQLVK